MLFCFLQGILCNVFELASSGHTYKVNRDSVFFKRLEAANETFHIIGDIPYNWNYVFDFDVTPMCSACSLEDLNTIDTNIDGNYIAENLNLVDVPPYETNNRSRNILALTLTSDSGLTYSITIAEVNFQGIKTAKNEYISAWNSLPAAIPDFFIPSFLSVEKNKFSLKFGIEWFSDKTLDSEKDSKQLSPKTLPFWIIRNTIRTYIKRHPNLEFSSRFPHIRIIYQREKNVGTLENLAKIVKEKYLLDLSNIRFLNEKNSGRAIIIPLVDKNTGEFHNSYHLSLLFYSGGLHMSDVNELQNIVNNQIY